MKIHHYTSVETLALILKTKKIRLNNLIDVNDLDEGNTTDCGNVGQYFFVSCWTKEPKESIPLWNLYNGLSGVRITFSNNFIGESNNESSQFRIEENETYLMKDFLDSEVIYTDDEKLLFPNIVNGDKINFDLVGRYKRTAWSFEKEWRIKRFGANMIANYARTEREKLLTNDNGDVFRFFNDNPFKFHDCPIFENHFKEMEILLGPKISDGNKIIVNDLVAKYNPKAKITESCLKIR